VFDGPFIEVRNVTKRFGGVTALQDVSFDIAAGEFHAIVGENGAGKSTLMKILAGVITDYDGALRLHGEPVAFDGTRDAERRGVSIIHQELNLVDELTVAANIFLGREKRTRLGLVDDRAMEREAAGLFEELQCGIRPDTFVRDLRVGDQQLVEIAKALSFDADILIMDEPTSALTESEVDRLFRVIERLQKRGVTILYISHKMDEVFRLSDRITVLRDGKHVATVNREETSPRKIAHLMVGREIESVHFDEARKPGDVLLRVEKLSLPWTGHARQWRLRDISFELRRGEVLGIAGLMGAGRTELLECLFGTSPEPPLGRMEIAGRELRPEHPSQAMREGIALVTEDRKRLGLFSHMTVRENITLCTLREAAVAAGVLSSRRERRQAEESIGLLAVKTGGPEAPVSSLSGGNQQKCVIARWLRTEPRVLLLDDPTRGVDVGAKAEIYRIIDGLCRDGLGIIVTSSELPELLTLCDRILVLCEGRLTGEFHRGEFTEQAIMEAATARGNDE
jgi:ABC-type sugar transport system ATPase subunit